jgi:hypothetical protein
MGKSFANPWYRFWANLFLSKKSSERKEGIDLWLSIKQSNLRIEVQIK